VPVILAAGPETSGIQDRVPCTPVVSFTCTDLPTADIHLVSEYGRRLLRSSTDRTISVPRTHNKFGDRSSAAAGTVCLLVCVRPRAAKKN